MLSHSVGGDPCMGPWDTRRLLPRWSPFFLPPCSVESLLHKVRTFIRNEDRNFSLFNYVNEQQNEVEKLEEQLQQLEEEERKFAQVE